MEQLTSLITQSRQRVDQTLARWLPDPQQPPQRLHAAMRYAVLNGGKRVRPLLVYAAGAISGAVPSALDVPAAALELIHAFSLIHDDLPAMDDDDLRRGQPTCHKAFDEATAILAGDALQALAFTILAEDPTITATAAARLQMVATLAHATGAAGMCGGQAIDIAAVGITPALADLEQMHRAKTGALINAALQLGLLSGESDSATTTAIARYGAAIGLAFQVRDDILDVEGDTATLGKPQGSDSARDKPTYTSLLGIAGARDKLQQLHAEAHAALEPLPATAEPLRWLADYIVARTY